MIRITGKKNDFEEKEPVIELLQFEDSMQTEFDLTIVEYPAGLGAKIASFNGNREHFEELLQGIKELLGESNG